MTNDDETSREKPKKKARKRKQGDETAPTDAPAAVIDATSEPVVVPRAPYDDTRAGALHLPLLGAAAAAAVGLAMVGTGPSEAGMWIAVVGGIGLIASIHRLGRLGAA